MSQVINFLADSIIGKIYLAFVIIATIGQIAFLANILMDRFLERRKAKIQGEEAFDDRDREKNNLDKTLIETPANLELKKAKPIDLPDPLEEYPAEEYNIVDYLNNLEPEANADAGQELYETKNQFEISDQFETDSLQSDGDFTPPTSSHNTIINEEEEDIS